MPARSRPTGRHTRGKTAENRLRRIDTYVALAHAEALRGPSPLVVDVGFGASAWTTLETAQRWRRVNPALRVAGVEIDPARVEAALPFADPPSTAFLLGGFEVADHFGVGSVAVIRCYNVLRQYEEAEVIDALARMGAALAEGGLLVEGTSNPTGSMTAFDIWRREGELLAHEALVLGTNFRRPHEPAEFRTILPKRLIHRMLDEEPARFFDEWQRAALRTSAARESGLRAWWAASAEELRRGGTWPIDPRPRLVERGFLTIGSTLGGPEVIGVRDRRG